MVQPLVDGNPEQRAVLHISVAIDKLPPSAGLIYIYFDLSVAI